MNPDFEYKLFGKDSEMESYKNLDETALSFDSYMNKPQYFSTPGFGLQNN